MSHGRALVAQSLANCIASSAQIFAFGGYLQLSQLDLMMGQKLRKLGQDSEPIVARCREYLNFPAGAYIFLGTVVSVIGLTTMALTHCSTWCKP